jgi:hypothetical protein
MRKHSLFTAVVASAAALPLVGGQAAATTDTMRPRLWNTFDSVAATADSAIGPDFTVLGDPVHWSGVSGRSIGTVDDETVLLMSARKFFGWDNTEGTVSVFLKKRMVASIPYETPFNGVFGAQPYDFQDAWCATALKNPGSDSCTNYAIAALWGDGLSGPAGLYFQVVDADGVSHVAVDRAFNTTKVPVRTWVHVKFVWDLDGIGCSPDRLRIYRDGRIVARYSEPIDSVLSLPTPVAFAGSHATYRNTGPSLMYDELMVFDRALAR